MAPKDKNKKFKKQDNISVQVPTHNYYEEYIGQSRRSFGERLKEHLRAPSPIHHHGHTQDTPLTKSASP